MTADAKPSLPATEESPAETELRSRLARTIQLRATTQLELRKSQKELERLLVAIPPRPRQPLADVNEQLRTLETYRETHSLSLAEEKALLRRIHSLEAARCVCNTYTAADVAIRCEKALTASLRGSLQSQTQQIAALRDTLQTTRTARKLGCDVAELQKVLVDCPPAQLGRVIGKDGSNVRAWMQKYGVTIDVDRERHQLALKGSHQALECTLPAVQRIVDTTERDLSTLVSTSTVAYWTTKHITALEDLRSRYSHVYIDIQRGKHQKQHLVRLRGIPVDLDSVQHEMELWRIVTKTVAVDAAAASVILGKKGNNITRMVQTHQVTMDVTNPSGSASNDHSNETNSMSTTATTKMEITGPVDNVTAAVQEIEQIMADHERVVKTVPVDRNVQEVFLHQSGLGIKATHKVINDAIQTIAPGALPVNVGDKGDQGGSIVLRGKAMYMETAVSMVEKEAARVQNLIVQIRVDPLVIPLLIGPSGTNIRKLMQNHPAATLLIDRDGGIVTIGGLEAAPIQALQAEIEAMVRDNQLERVKLDAQTYHSVVAAVLRSSKIKEMNKLNIKLFTQDDTNEIVLRGSAESLPQAASLVRDVISENYIAELAVDVDDLKVLLEGGKKSPIVEFSNSFGVQLSSNRETQVVTVRGPQDRVNEATAAVNSFLYGGEGHRVAKIPLNRDGAGVVIGRGGKTRIDLEKKYGVTVQVHRTNDHVTVRGTADAVEDCNLEIARLLLTASVVESLDVSEEQSKGLISARLAALIQKTVPVRISVGETKVTVRGCRHDVNDAVALLKEQLYGIYEGRIVLDIDYFHKMQDACKDLSHFTRIKRNSGVELSVDESAAAIVVTGQREKVKGAKLQLFSLFGFIFDSSFTQLAVPPASLSTIGQVAVLAEVSSASGGASVLLDRDTHAILIFAQEASKVSKAKNEIEKRMQLSLSRLHVIELESSEDWLVATTIGKGGKNINALRKRTGCSIDVDSTKRKIVISSENEQSFDNGRKEVEDFNVNIQTMRNTPVKGLRITGEKDFVAAAKTAIQEWIAFRQQAREEADMSESMPLRHDQISVILGTKGSTVRSLQSEFGCRVNVERQSPCCVLVQGGSPGKRQATLAKIRELLLSDAVLKSENLERSNDPGSHFIEMAVQSQSKVHREQVPQTQRNVKKKGVSSWTEYFPVLDSGADEQKTETSSTSTFIENTKNESPSWSTIVQIPTMAGEISNDVKQRRSFVSMVSDDDWDATSVGSDPADHQLNAELRYESDACTKVAQLMGNLQ